MSSEELGANLFRATQAEAKLKRDIAAGKSIGQQQADKTHYEVGKKVRLTIKELGGSMPEELPAVEHIKGARQRLKSMAYEISAPLHQDIPEYEVPNDVSKIQAIILCINQHPGNHLIRMGDSYYRLSGHGLKVVEQIMSKNKED